RYGFKDKPERIRFRILDAARSPLPGVGLADVALDADSFAALPVSARHVFITENETNFLAFPALPDSLVVFGAGYGWDSLAKARWLADCRIRYWGDIDTHGFAILNQLRARFGRVESLLMDRATLAAHEQFWGTEKDQALQDLPLLTPDESALYDDLRDNRIRNNLRLEQEFIGFGWVERALAQCISVNDD
ncbi:MAG: Wadjet anti-phage system protein JetD domain-containing protein, partial [Gammaproteobacteria bacterium]